MNIQSTAHYLIGNAFITIVTDHSPLLSTVQGKHATNRRERWIMDLLEFNFKFVHRKGQTIPHVDALSRLLPGENGTAMHTMAEELDLKNAQSYDHLSANTSLLSMTTVQNTPF